MKIAVSFPGCHRRGGVERIVFECAQFLAQQGHLVDVYCSQWQDPQVDGLSFRNVPTVSRPKFLTGLSFHRAAAREMKKQSYDVHNSHGCVCPVGGIHWVQSLHIAWLERAKQFRPPFSGPWWKQRLNPLHPMLLRLESAHFLNRAYEHVIVTTEQVRDDLNHFYNVPASDVSIVPNGFAPTEFNPEFRAMRRNAVRERLELRRSDIAILFVANELDRKGYGTLLSAMRILDNRDIKLLVVGRYSLSRARKLASDAKLTGQVMLCGSTSDVAEYHAAADLFVLPTQYEAFCLAILEALGSGLPVITTSVPGARDAIQPGINGEVIEDPLSGKELAAAIRPLLDPTTRARYSEAAPATVECYQWPRVLARYEELLRRYARN